MLEQVVVGVVNWGVMEQVVVVQPFMKVGVFLLVVVPSPSSP